MNKISYTGYRFPPEIIHQEGADCGLRASNLRW